MEKGREDDVKRVKTELEDC